MIYSAYQTQSDLTQPFRSFAEQALANVRGIVTGLNGYAGNTPFGAIAAGFEMMSRAKLSHARPAFGIDRVTVGNREVAVTEQAAMQTPFGTLLHFKKDIESAQPRVLVVAPLSGHFATLLRETVKTLLSEHDVYVTDWHNARDMPLEAGRFGFDEYIDHLIQFMQAIGPGAHVVAVCQPCVAALVATSVMAKNGMKAQPKSLTLMAGPVDCRVNPTKVNELASGKSIEWFEKNMISVVPPQHKGAGRHVYPGFVQLSAFMSMNMERHVKAHMDLYQNLARGEFEKAQAIKDFYDEYFAVLDLTAEFYLETVQWIFQEYRLPKGELKFQGDLVEPEAIRRTSLLTVEGENDDICAMGQTLAAQDLCSGIRPHRKHHHMQAGVGHYGVFSGKKWNQQIYPVVRNTILAAE
ncbi:MAG: polyhydroxyalkanoate depolymerase [Rhizobiales bacterium]|jgi:poly(3-hydroxybutyrate) depolymerase|nr:polyhydroxyalkanoate depolymerase [Hyphomicrobiales bacterium]